MSAEAPENNQQSVPSTVEQDSKRAHQMAIEGDKWEMSVLGAEKNVAHEQANYDAQDHSVEDDPRRLYNAEHSLKEARAQADRVEERAGEWHDIMKADAEARQAYVPAKRSIFDRLRRKQ